ncbi:fumarylacetoacetate hydrolase family protein [Desulfohalovibrio reitneri]|uniref:fumarylacetoacetate hydrolase family protein n=1 Tax=Desulfohalovibrio reitneri TaxID=1307759 RepID=UPI0004A7845C|nr:fumarylacetoacetate hydrolase family protein [Desulfohalovibrio reitneri]
MRIIRVRHKGHVFYASLMDKSVICLNKELGLEDPIPLDEVAVLPVVTPSKIVCAGLNYAGHCEEMGREPPEETPLFLKPPTAIAGSGQPIVLPRGVGRVDYEAELAVVMGKTCKDIAPEQATEHIFGYTCANDVTARDLQAKDGIFGRAKGFDTFCPIGPWIETEVEDPSNLSLRTLINEEVRQEGATSDMLTPPLDLVSYVSRVMTLNPGDIILTGTPAGVGPIQEGDEVRVEIDNVGILINPVVASEEAVSGPLQ